MKFWNYSQMRRECLLSFIYSRHHHLHHFLLLSLLLLLLHHVFSIKDSSLQKINWRVLNLKYQVNSTWRDLNLRMIWSSICKFETRWKLSYQTWTAQVASACQIEFTIEKWQRKLLEWNLLLRNDSVSCQNATYIESRLLMNYDQTRILSRIEFRENS